MAIVGRNKIAPKDTLVNIESEARKRVSELMKTRQSTWK